MLSVFFYLFSIIAVLSAIMVIIASWEYCNLIKLSLFSKKSFYIIVILACTFLSAINPSILKVVLYFTLAWWIIAFFIVVSHPKNSNLLNQNMTINLLNGLFLFVPMAASLTKLHSQHKSFVLLLLLYIWASDIGAYFVGRRFGNKKLCPKVSPNKTWEGVYGGVTLTQVIAVVYVLSSIQSPTAKDFLVFCFLALIVSLVSVIGDLF